MMTWSSVLGGMVGAVLVSLLGHSLSQLVQLATEDERHHSREWFARVVARTRSHRSPAFRNGATVAYTLIANEVDPFEVTGRQFN